MKLNRKQFIKLLGLSSLAGLPKIDISSNLNRISPNRLPSNPTIGLIAPASPIYNPDDYRLMIENLTDIGFKLIEGEYTEIRNYGYLAGTDEQRALDLNNAFKNNKIDAILCIRGGYGSARILDLIDFEAIKENPKPLIGFSDITALHLAINKKTGLTTFHGPVGKSEWNTYTLDLFNSILKDAEKALITIPDLKKEQAFTINKGISNGELIGGNLTVLCSLLGSEYEPDWVDKILFLEDVGEDVYKVDRMLTQLKLNGVLDSISGFIFGECTSCTQSNNSFSLKEVLNHHIKPLKVPAFYGAMISHDLYNATMPIGVNARMDANLHTIKLTEAAVL